MYYFSGIIWPYKFILFPLKCIFSGIIRHNCVHINPCIVLVYVWIKNICLKKSPANAQPCFPQSYSCHFFWEIEPWERCDFSRPKSLLYHTRVESFPESTKNGSAPHHWSLGIRTQIAGPACAIYLLYIVFKKKDLGICYLRQKELHRVFFSQF